MVRKAKIPRRQTAALVLAGVACVLAGPVSARTCLEEVRLFAETYDMSSAPPEVDPGGNPEGVSPDDLARSGGVIEPPPTSDPATIEPPPGVGRDMPTLPAIPDEPVAPLQREGEPPPLSPSDRATVESIIVAARADAERGDERGCFEKLKDAKRIAQRESS